MLRGLDLTVRCVKLMRQLLQYARYLVIMGMLALAAGRGCASSGATASAGAAAGVRIVIPLDINKTADLRFGRLFYSNNANTVTVAPDGTRTASDDAILGEGDPVSAAAFLLHGHPNDTFHVFTPDSHNTMTNGVQTVTVSDFTCSIKTSHNGTLGSDGMFTFTYGATVHLNAGQSPGWYTGTFDVAVNYE